MLLCSLLSSKVMDAALSSLLLLMVVMGDCVGDDDSTDIFEISVRMPNATSEAKDALVCHAHKVPDREAYILKFVPHASMRVAHHLMVYGCSKPGTMKPTWSCPSLDDSISDMAVCGEGARQIVFAWANDAPDKNLPDGSPGNRMAMIIAVSALTTLEFSGRQQSNDYRSLSRRNHVTGVGLRVGGTTGIDYLVLQLHYAIPFGAEASDNSGVTLHMTYKRQVQQAGYYVLGNVGVIPPHLPAFRMESGCSYSLNYTIYPIGYRTHGHNIAVVTSGYRIRDGVWTELGRMSPQRPQTFYNISTPGIDVKKGDMLVSRCTFNSLTRDEPTEIGPTNADEMCNFYILYATYEQADLKLEHCFRDGNSFAWNNYFNSTPADASSLHGITGADEIRHHFNMDPR